MPGGVFSDAEFEAVTKLVQADMVHKFVHKKSRVFGMIRKEPTWPGDPQHEVKWKVADGGGGGATFSGARGNTSYGTYKKPVVDRILRYQFGRIDNISAKATKTKAGSALALATEAIDDAWKGWGRRNGHIIWSDPGCSLAQIAEDLGSNVYRLTDPRATIYFTLKQKLQASADDGNTSTDTLYAGEAIVVGISHADGTITLDNGAALNPGTGLAAGDFVFAFDTFQQGLIGIPGWIPPTAPVPGEDFYGVDRSIWPDRMAGTRFEAREAILPATERFAAQIDFVGGEPKIIVVNSLRFSEIKLELQATTEIKVNVKETNIPNGPTWSFRAPVYQSPWGPMPIVADRYAPYRYMWMLDPESFYLKSLDAWPHYADENGGILHPLEGDDASRFVMRGVGQLCCTRPFDNGVMDLDPS